MVWQETVESILKYAPFFYGSNWVIHGPEKMDRPVKVPVIYKWPNSRGTKYVEKNITHWLQHGFACLFYKVSLRKWQFLCFQNLFILSSLLSNISVGLFLSIVVVDTSFCTSSQNGVRMQMETLWRCIAGCLTCHSVQTSSCDSWSFTLRRRFIITWCNPKPPAKGEIMLACDGELQMLLYFYMPSVRLSYNTPLVSVSGSLPVYSLVDLGLPRTLYQWGKGREGWATTPDLFEIFEKKSFKQTERHIEY